MKNYLFSKEDGLMQLPYGEYEKLMEHAQEGNRIREVKASVVAGLRSFLGAAAPALKTAPVAEEAPLRQDAPAPEKVSVEFAAEMPQNAPAPVQEQSLAKKKAMKSPAPKPASRSESADISIPPIKKEIAAFFNKQDDSSRLFNVLKQYYTCLNEACGGTVRVTMKDGVCSLWNYDEWEEFAFVDIFERHLRISLDPRCSERLKSLNFCEVPRLLSGRRNLISAQVDDLNKIMLDVLIQAFDEVGMTA
ncbi:hypothetical protein [Pontiella sulfatireligans]|nr:hypothetical protein [Pontiella sulfatireligans]